VTPVKEGRPDAKGSAGRSFGEAAKFDALTVARRLSLTPAEARVAAALTEGLSYAEIAERLGVSYHTVHTHVKTIHVKAGVGTTGRLLALLRKMQED
jgi:DNA-binding CsgD family transcriptional regulator